MLGSLDEKITEITREVISQRDAIIFEQLQELISRGLLEIREEEPVMIRVEADFQNPGRDRIMLKQRVKLILKNQEYVEKLEAENKQLKERIARIEGAING